MDEDTATANTSPVLVIRLYERNERGMYSGDIANSLDMQLAIATAPDFDALWAMLQAVVMREVEPC